MGSNSSSVMERLDAVSTVASMAEEMTSLLKKAHVKNERLLSCVNRLRHEAAKHEKELSHILAKKGDRREIVIEECNIEDMRKILLDNGVSEDEIEEIDAMLKEEDGNADDQSAGEAR